MWTHWLVSFFWLFAPLVLCGKAADRVFSLPDYNGLGIRFKQYAGYLSLLSGNQLFYWLTESSSPTKSSDPILLWLNGGPGCSSMTGLMTEMGPFRVLNEGMTLTDNPHAWNRFAHLVFLDAPSGVGFAKNNVANFTFTDSQVASDNLEAVSQFFNRFPELCANDFYVGGESYGGTYVPMLADLIVKRPEKFPNFKGIIVGNGCLKESLRYNSQIGFNYNHNFIAEEVYNEAVKTCCDGRPAETCDWYSMSNGSDQKCAKISNALEEANFYSGFDPYFIDYACYLNETVKPIIKQPNVKSRSFRFRHNEMLVATQSCVLEDVHVPYLNRDDVQRSIHVWPKINYTSCSEKIAENYVVEFDDMSDFVRRIVDAGKKVLFFNGDADSVCSFVHNQKFVGQLGYSLVHQRTPWMYENKIPPVAGYYSDYKVEFIEPIWFVSQPFFDHPPALCVQIGRRQARKRVDYLSIHGAGHFAASTLEKPRESLQMFYNFLHDRNYSHPVPEC